MAAYYNEFDPFAAQWLRNLIAAGHIAPGDVDDRSITEVSADDIRGYTQAHFFAGIGLWSLALRWAGWPDDRPVWTGSCPCQPFSGAGRQEGYADARHLAPVWLRLIAECRPASVLGEQVAAKAGRAWLAALRAELEDLGYAVGAADLCAAGIGAPHIRQRLWFGAQRLADATGIERERDGEQPATSRERQGQAGGRRSSERLGDGEQPGLEGHAGHGDGAPGRPVEIGSASEAGGDGGLANTNIEDQSGRGIQRPGEGAGEGAGAAQQRSARLRADGGVADAECERRERREGAAQGREHDGAIARRQEGNDGLVSHDETGTGPRRPRPPHVDWRDADWLFCRDGKWRPVEPGTFPLVDGDSGRVGKLRAYGNAIVPSLAAEFIAAFMEARP